jgi:membrane protein YqaA with SNARE-associated domain
VALVTSAARAHSVEGMVGMLLVTLGVAAGSALLPLLSVEVFVLGLMAAHPAFPVLAVGAAAGIGQVTGKLLYFLAARGTIRLPSFLRRERPLTDRRHRLHMLTKRVRALFDGVREKCVRHPKWMFGSYAASTVVGAPPLRATTVLAGMARMPVWLFLTTGVAGRTIRFTVLAAAPALLAGWLF